MNENESDPLGFNRRDFLRGGSFATLMTMLGGVPLLAPAEEPAPAQTKPDQPRVKVAVIGLGAWGREIISSLARLPIADIAAICDTYAPALTRAAKDAPNAAQTKDYQTILANNDIKAVLVATPTQLHKDIVIAALKAGKHVYCEAPLANTIEDARAIALAAKATPQVVFQSGLQLRSDPERLFLHPFIRSGALGRSVMARAQWHKKDSWRAAAPNPEREKALNWRLDKAISLGLVGEIGIHSIDQANWFLNAHPTAITGFGSLILWNQDGREVPDTIQAVFDYPGGVRLSYDATLANSFDAAYEVLYGTDAAVMMRDNKAWLFKEADSPLLGWEVYAHKDTFYKETGIALVAGASKLQQIPKGGEEPPSPTRATLSAALETFLRNANDVTTTLEPAREAFKDDPSSLQDLIASVKLRPAAGALEGFQATVLAVKANEAVLGGKRIELKKEWYELS